MKKINREHYDHREIDLTNKKNSFGESASQRRK